MTLVELLMVCAILALVMGGLGSLFVSGLHAGTRTDAHLAGQENIRVAFDRLEYEARCADTAQILSSGAGVALDLPPRCSNATGTAAWCVSAGSLVRYGGLSTCGPGTAMPLINGITSPTPFSCLVPAGASLPQLQVTLTVNTGTSSATATTATDTITMRNATGTSACA